MCLAVPGQIVQLGEERLAQVDLGGVVRQVSVEFLDQVAVGDWVLVHAGFALSRVDEAQAAETLALLLRSIQTTAEG